jgi:hypothetical protein
MESAEKRISRKNSWLKWKIENFRIVSEGL